MRHSVTGQTFVDIALMRLHCFGEQRGDDLYTQLGIMADSGQSFDDKYGYDFAVTRVPYMPDLDILEIQWGCHSRNVRFGYLPTRKELINVSFLSGGEWIDVVGVSPRISDAVDAGYLMMALDGLNDVFETCWEQKLSALNHNRSNDV